MGRIRFYILLLAGLSVSLQLYSQNTKLFADVAAELSSSRYQGRGYARNGVIKAGKTIEKLFRSVGADNVTLQPFCIDINTFPGVMKMSVDGQSLSAGQDFVMREYSAGVKGSFPLYYIDTVDYDSDRLFAELERPENSNCMVVADFWFTYRHKADFKRLESAGGAPNAGVIYVWDTPLKFYKAYGEKVSDKPIIWVSKDFPVNAGKVKLNVKNKFLASYESNNVIARVEGSRHDSCYVFTAHYDHLGNLGRRLYFPGANDNASGTAAIIALAGYYALNKPEFDMYFIAFSGEDANLRGSTWFVEHPLIDLGSIRFLFNLDMVADNNPVQYCEVSEQGMPGLKCMESINTLKHYFQKLEQGELAANSDHWPFAQKGVPCIMFENESGEAFPYYHTAADNMSHFYTGTFESLFRLITDFIAQ